MTEKEFVDVFKTKVLEVLKYSISFFDKHQLNWFIACGSAIGAVRHKGFIPWDDDVDIYMPRKDYNKLFAIRDEMLKDGYRFVCFEDDGYPLSFGKVSDNHTTLWSERRFPFNYGVYVDIFPLDLTDCGMMSFGIKWTSYRMLMYQYRAKLSKVSLGAVFDDIRMRQSDSIRALLAKIPMLFVKKNDLKKKMKQLEQSWDKENGDRYVSYTEAGMYMFPKEWFEDYVLVPFEDIEVRIPKHYDEYLTYIYGDYMTPPPVEKRKMEGSHGKYYVNFRENIPLPKLRNVKRKNVIY